MKLSTLLTTVLLALACLLVPAYAEEANYGSVTVSEVLRVYDGSTLYVNIDEWPDVIGKGLMVHIDGIRAGNLRSPECEHEKNVAESGKRILEGMVAKSSKITLTNIRRGTFFSIYADVGGGRDGKNDMAQWLMGQSVARSHEYYKTSPWCR